MTVILIIGLSASISRIRRRPSFGPVEFPMPSLHRKPFSGQRCKSEQYCESSDEIHEWDERENFLKLKLANANATRMSMPFTKETSALDVLLLTLIGIIDRNIILRHLESLQRSWTLLLLKVLFDFCGTSTSSRKFQSGYQVQYCEAL